MNNTKKKIIGIGAGALAVIGLVMGSIAYFTDRATGNANVQASDLSITLTNLTMTTDDPFAPGVAVPITMTTTNTGSLATDVRDMFVVTVFGSDGTTPLNLSAGDAAEFKIYKASDVTYNSTTGYTIASGATPIEIDNASGNKIVFYGDTYQLDGSDNELGDGVADSRTGTQYMLVFNRASSNDFQNANVTLEAIVEAKQHAYNGVTDADWAVVDVKELTTPSGTYNTAPETAEYIDSDLSQLS